MIPAGIENGWLQRIDQPATRTRGWQARRCVTGTRAQRYTRNGSPRYRSAFFADKKYGGTRKAKRLALAFLQGAQ